MYLQLKITGSTPLHNRLPGEEFYLRCDANGSPINSLWAKRINEERNQGVGAIQVLNLVDRLPDGEAAAEDAGASVPPPRRMESRTVPFRIVGQDEAAGSEERIMASLARALAGVRAEIERLRQAAPSATQKFDFDSMQSNLMALIKPQLDMIRMEGQKAAQATIQQVLNEKIENILINDAWRVRMSLPPDWQPGMQVSFAEIPPIIQAHAARYFEGDVGAAAMHITEGDLEWQRKAANDILTRPEFSTSHIDGSGS